MAIPFIHVQAKGDYRELGRAVGEAAREQIRASVAFFAENFAAMTRGRLTFADAETQAEAYVGATRGGGCPSTSTSSRAWPKGPACPFSQLLVLNCGEEFTSDEPVAGEAPVRPARRPPAAPPASGGDHCTAVAIAAGGRHVVGHNMDWYVIDAVNNVLFDLTVPDGTRVMGIAGAPYLLMLGMNSHGIGNVSNSVHSTDNRVGVPNAFVRRWTLEAATLEEARARGLLGARARGTNHFLADTGGRLWDIETSATGSAFVDHSAAGFMAHTNHYAAAADGARRGLAARGVPRPPGHGGAPARRGHRAWRRPGRARGARPALPRTVARTRRSAATPTRASRRSIRSMTVGQHDLRPRRASRVRLRRAAVREPLPGVLAMTRRAASWRAARRRPTRG